MQLMDAGSRGRLFSLNTVGLPTITSSFSTSKQSKQINGDLDESTNANESAPSANLTDIAVGAAEDKDAAVAAESGPCRGCCWAADHNF